MQKEQGVETIWLKPDATILDACCGSRMFWFDKFNEDVIFMDNRELDAILCDGRILNIHPDVIADFRDMPFPDGRFDLVVFDPPHIDNLGANSWMALKYGTLSENWEDDIRAGFNECMRVLRGGGYNSFQMERGSNNHRTSFEGRRQKTTIRQQRTNKKDRLDGLQKGGGRY